MENVKKEQVRKFYELVWDAQDKNAMLSILHKNFTFQGSLEQEKRDRRGFSEYVDMLHKSLGDYKCIIEELVSEADKVFAKMSFTGIHQDEFIGFPPTQQRVSWSGCALFTFKNELVTDLWVLGDLKTLEEQLRWNST